jgi:TPR repeat protein
MKSFLTSFAALFLCVFALSARAQLTTPSGEDQTRCKAGDIASCVRSETSRCDMGDAKACVDLGGRYFSSMAVSRDTTRGRRLYVRAFYLADSSCTAGDLSGCAIAGIAYGTGRGTPRDLDRAKALEERACAGGNADGCANLGVAYLVGAIGVARDSIRAAQLLEPACAGGHANACFQLGWNYEFGRTVARDYKRAAAFYQKACDAPNANDDMMGCHFLGSAYAEGRGVREDAAHAAQLYGRACQGGNGSGCNNLGQLYQVGRAVAKDASRAAQLYDRACQLGNPSGCDNLSLLYESGSGVPREADRARQLRQQACALGFPPACKSSSETTPGTTLGGTTALSPTPPSVPTLVGAWEATSGHLKNNVGGTLLFSAEGTLTIVIGRMVDGKYTLDGNQLTLHAPGAGTPDVQKLTFAGDTAVISYGAKNRKLIPLELTPRPNGLVGQWRSTDAGVVAYEEYTADGIMRLRVPMKVAKGFYSIRGDTLTRRFLSPRTEEDGVLFTLRGNTLTTRGRDGKPELFVRARQLLPTDVDNPGLPIR